MVVKQMLLMRGLNEVYRGGLGSYALAMMIHCFLKGHPHIQSGGIKQQDNLGVLLMEFLELFGKKWRFETVGIAIDGTFRKVISPV
jgi:non-canonical poly(A) RNA polymerase PAPD5/7